MTRRTTSLRRLAALTVLAVLEVALRALARLIDRPKSESREWSRDDGDRHGGEW